MELVAIILFIFATATFLGCLPTFTALWRRIMHGIVLLRDEVLVRAARRAFHQDGDR